MRYFEERNIANNAERFQKEAKEQARAMAFFGEKYNPSEMFNFAQQAKSALISYNERFATKIVPSMVTMLGGDRAGTAANMFNKTIMGRVNDKLQAAEWMRLGLLDPKQAIMKAGHAVAWKPGAIKGTDLAMQDPFAWAEKVMIPAIIKGGADASNVLSMTKALALLFRNSSANTFASDLSLPASRQRLHKDEANIERTGAFDEINRRNQAQDSTVAVDNLSKALTNFGAAATRALPAADVLNALATQLNAFATKGLIINGGADLASDWARVGDKIASGWGRVGSRLISGIWKPSDDRPKAPSLFSQIEGAGPHLDVRQIDGEKANIVAAGNQMKEALSFTASPHVDAGGALAQLDALIAKANAAKAAINGIGGAAASAGSLVDALSSKIGAASAKVGSLRAQQNSQFGASGQKGE